HASHSKIWRSVPQMPVARTRIFTSLMPACGSGTSSIQRPRAAFALTRAFILLLSLHVRSVWVPERLSHGFPALSSRRVEVLLNPEGAQAVVPEQTSQGQIFCGLGGSTIYSIMAWKWRVSAGQSLSKSRLKSSGAQFHAEAHIST